ncbi:hypothetical protein CDV31_007012 [Fusarium ambrosium]|uniref:Uncharacterized protein n=1 Tax=Fusarium ambrosium TaxID=131363 RepID=A0A428U9L3_9HYPO|nr:hypothetical protein CDV31_007012 [Fusarium ambrosium]
MASHSWSLSAGRALLLLASLPLYTAQDVPDPALPIADPAATTTSIAFPEVFPDADAPAGPSTTETVAPVPSTTDIAIVVEQTTSSTEVPVVETTTSSLIPEGPETVETLSTTDSQTTEGPVQDTTTSTEVPAQDTTTSTEVPVAPTTTSSWIPDASETLEPINTPGSTATSTELPVQDTTTSTEVPIDTTTSTELPAGTTTSTELPVDTTTSTEVVAGTTTSTEVPVDTTTSTEVPVDTTTSTEVPVDTTTTTGVPVGTTTTEQLPETTTTSDVAVEPTTTTEQVIDATTTTEHPAEETSTTAGQPSDTTTEQAPEPTITEPPVLTTATGAAATSAVSSVSTEILGLIPIIDSWKEDPENLKDETKDKVDDVHDDIIAVIVSLGGDPNQDCAGKRKRGLLGPIGDIINSLVCIAKDLADISGNIVVGNIPAVTGTTSGVQSQTEELTEEEKDEDKTDEKSEQESTEQEESTTEEPTSTTTSPCTDDTAEHVTIICKPTTITEGGNVQTTETCFESITVEVTGCSVTEATTVISTTGTAAAITPCASGSCGGGDACPMNDAPLSGAEMALVSTKVDCAAVSTITTSEIPTGAGAFGSNPVTSPTPRAESGSAEKRDLDRRVFMHNTTPNPFYVASLNPLWVSQIGDASGHWFDYPAIGQGFAGVNGIYGCTAVIIVSDKGVYLSHIWENPVFIDTEWNWTDDESFNRNAFEALRDGTDNARSVTSLVGDDANPGVLHASNNPIVFVLTPFTDVLNDPTGITTLFRYQERAQRLADSLVGVIPGSSGHLLGYTRTNGIDSTEPIGTWGRAILEVDMFQDMIITPEDTPGGSWAFSMGRWRLWVEDGLVTWRDFIVGGSGIQLSGFATTSDAPAPDATQAPEEPQAEAPEATQAAETVAQRLRKREDSPVEECLVVTRSSTSEATSSATETSQTTESTESTETTQSTESTQSTETTQSSTETVETTQSSTETSETTKTTESTQSTETTESTAVSTSETSEATTESTRPPTTLRTSVITTTSAPDTTSDEPATTEPPFTGPVICVNHGGPRVATPYCQCSTTTEGQVFYATAPLISYHCTDYTTFPSSVSPTPTKEETPSATATNPNADVPEVECATPDDCDDWEGNCHFANDNNHVVCLATDWHDVNGIPTSGKAICECLIREKPADPPKGTNPNADVPEIECATPDDCGDWEGDCAFGPSSNHVVCLATDWHNVNGVPTSGKAICECMVTEV